MKKLKAYTLTVILAALTFPQASRAAVAPPVDAQVKEVAQWFTGLFNNTQQISSNPSVPFVSMSNCKVQVAGVNPANGTENIYLEQESSAFKRTAFYSYSKGNSAVNLSVSSIVNGGNLGGLCNKPESERIIDISNISTGSCNLLLMWEPSRYVGTNSPSGCPTSTGGKIVSNVGIFENGVDALDQIFDAKGNLLVATPIEFRRINSIPEPSLTIGLLAFGVLSVSSAQRLKQIQSSIKKQKTFNSL
ncbi:CpeT/CpcT protein [Brasilonema sp. CT11]|nr:CpeT/CpcT protein [Brasilonema sp. CT11]